MKNKIFQFFEKHFSYFWENYIDYVKIFLGIITPVFIVFALLFIITESFL